MNLKKLQQNKAVITDTSCFILLDKIGALHVLNETFAAVITTPDIAEEYGHPLPDWITIEPADASLTEKFHKYVDRGEASAIALATQITFDYLILDDGTARKLAVKLGMPVKGTIGVLLFAKQKGIIPLFRPYLELIQQTNFRLSQQLAEQFIHDAGE